MKDVKAIDALLIVLIVAGLVTSFLYSLNLELDSDTVVPGLVAMEFVEHGNYQFIFPVDDPYLFTDIFTFYFVPQVLSNYDPTVLRLTAYFVFLCVVAVFSYLVYRFSNVTCALLFAALFANLQPAQSHLYLSPEYHVGSLLFAGIFLVLYHTDFVKRLPFYAVLAISFVVGLIVISDSIIIAFFVLPYLAYCLYHFWIRKPEDDSSNKKERSEKLAARKIDTSKIVVVLITLVLATAIAYVLKITNFFQHLILFFVTKKEVEATTIGTNLSLFIRSLFVLINDSFSHVFNSSLTWYDPLLILPFIAVVAYALIRRNERANYLYWMFLFSGLIMFAAFVFTTFGAGGSPRFLIYTALSVFAVIALAYRPEKPGVNVNTLFLLAVIVLILATVTANIVKISGMDFQPNKEDHELIKYLEDNNLTFGYTEINKANKLIYLSKEKVMYPKVEIINGEFKVLVMLTTTRWYDLSQGDGKLCLLVAKNDSYYNDVQKLLKVHPPNNTYYYGDSTIYQFNLT